MISHLLIIAVFILLAIRLLEVIFLVQQRLGRKNTIDPETTSTQ